MLKNSLIMKKIKILFLLLSTIGFFSACERELETEGISRITYYPVLTLKGEQWNSIPVGGTFTDAGITAKEGETDIEVSKTGTVDTSKPGVYTITYTAVNKDGYSASTRRYVGVISPQTAAIDLSGQYKRNAGALGVSTVTKLGPGFYQTDNVGGVATPGPATTVKFYHYEGNKLGVPAQLVNGSEFSAESATVKVGIEYSWVVINSGYGTALRTFVKQ
jgi:hypothetical protein